MDWYPTEQSVSQVRFLAEIALKKSISGRNFILNMTQQEIYQYFQYHNSNMKLLKIGFEEIRDQLKILYLSKNKSDDFIFSLADSATDKIQSIEKAKSLSRILSGIQVSWAEESIKRLFYEKDLLSDNQISYLLEQPLDQKWYKTLHIIFCIAYDLIPVEDEFCSTVNIKLQRRNLGNELVLIYFRLRRLITESLMPNFTIRNKVQHGEWAFAFRPSFSKEFSQELTDMLNAENLITTTSRFTLVNTFYHMLVDMARFKSNSFTLDSMLTPFEYYYQKNNQKINFEIIKIQNPKLENFIQSRIDKEIKGAAYRNRN